MIFYHIFGLLVFVLLPIVCLGYILIKLCSLIPMIKNKRDEKKKNKTSEKYESLKILEETVLALRAAGEAIVEGDSGRVPKELELVYKSFIVLRNTCRKIETMDYYKPLVDKYSDSFLLIKRTVDDTIKINLLGEKVVWKMTFKLVDSILLEFIEMEKLIKTNQNLMRQTELNSIVEQLKWETELVHKFRGNEVNDEKQFGQAGLFKKRMTA